MKAEAPASSLLEHCQGLKELTIPDGCNMGSDGAIAMAIYCPQLMLLHIGAHNNIRDDGVK